MRTLILVLSLVSIPYTKTADYTCPTGWNAYNNHCYKFYKDTPRNYAEARTTCTDDGAKLVKVDGKGEHDFISTRLIQLNDPQQFDWFTDGIREKPAGGQPGTSVSSTFVWEDWGGSIETDEFWSDVNIKGNAGMGDNIIYTFLDSQWVWSLSIGTRELPFICEISNTEVARISQRDRDLTYGSLTQDKQYLNRGPQFITQPEDRIYDPDSVEKFITFECLADGWPSPTYSWKKITQTSTTTVDPLTNSRYAIINGDLVIYEPSRSTDHGEYQCQATNKWGSILSRKVLLNFGYLEDFPNSARDPLAHTVYEGAVINCGAPSHYPAVIYQWYKNVPQNFLRPDLYPKIFLSQSGKLFFSYVTQDDTGDYYCLVYSPLSTASRGRSSRNIHMVVNKGVSREVEPIIQSGFPQSFPQNQALLRGMDVRLECFAYGTGDLRYEWSKKNGRLPLRARLEDHNRVLVIPKIEMADEGTYECTVRRVTGLSDSGEVTVTLGAEPYFQVSWKDEVVDEGSDIRWSCDAYGKPSVQYKWYKDGMPFDVTTITPDDRNRIKWNEAQNVLTIKEVNPQKDNGLYQCAAYNQYDINFLTRELRVLRFAPFFDKNPVSPNIYGTINGNVTIVCNPEASPRPEEGFITWQKNGQQLSLNDRVSQLRNGNLFIKNAIYADRGNYTCVAENSVGKAESTGYLDILESTTLQQRPTTRVPPRMVVTYGRSVTLYCQAAVNDKLDLDYIWTHNGREIDFEGEWDEYGRKIKEPDPGFARGSGQVRGNLVIEKITFLMDGFYKCIARTPVDEVEGLVELIVEGPPGEPAGVFGAVINHTAVTLTWTAGDDHRKPITNYIVEGLNKAEGVWKVVKPNITSAELGARQVTVNGLAPWSTYDFRLRAVNELGSGVPSLPSPYLTTNIWFPARAPYNISGGGGKVGTLQITWDPLPKWEQNGPGIGYIVWWRVEGEGDLDWSKNKIPDNGNEFVIYVGEQNVYRTYEARVQSYNDKGTLTELISDIYKIKSAMGLPIAVPINLQVEIYNATALEAFWTPVEDSMENVKGVLAGYRLNYWRIYPDNPELNENDLMAEVATIEGQTDHGLIIGLFPDQYYKVEVMVYNKAGNGKPSEPYEQKTLKSQPKEAPVEVMVHPYSSDSIKVTWRGITTFQDEEPLQGYMVVYWRVGETFQDAQTLDAAKETFLYIAGLTPGESYYLRVYGYSRGGQGTMSSPLLHFVMSKVPCVQFVPLNPEADYVRTCDGCQQRVSIMLIAVTFLCTLLSFNRT